MPEEVKFSHGVMEGGALTMPTPESNKGALLSQRPCSTAHSGTCHSIRVMAL
jgi:hypothetical protein